MKKYLIIFVAILFCAEVVFGQEGSIYIEGRSHASFYNTEISKIQLKSRAIDGIAYIFEKCFFEEGCVEVENGDTVPTWLRDNYLVTIPEFLAKNAKILRAVWEEVSGYHTLYVYTIQVKIDYDDLIEFVETEPGFELSLKLRLNHKRFCEVIETIPNIKAEGLYRMSEEEEEVLRKAMEEKFKQYKEENQ